MQVEPKTSVHLQITNAARKGWYLKKELIEASIPSGTLPSTIPKDRGMPSSDDVVVAPVSSRDPPRILIIDRSLSDIVRQLLSLKGEFMPFGLISALLPFLLRETVLA